MLDFQKKKKKKVMLDFKHQTELKARCDMFIFFTYSITVQYNYVTGTLGTPLIYYQFHLSSDASFLNPDVPLAISPAVSPYVPESRPPAVNCIISH